MVIRLASYRWNEPSRCPGDTGIVQGVEERRQAFGQDLVDPFHLAVQMDGHTPQGIHLLPCRHRGGPMHAGGGLKSPLHGARLLVGWVTAATAATTPSATSAT